MASLDEIKQGLGLDQILAREMPEQVYAALKSPALKQAQAVLDPDVDDNINRLIDSLLSAEADAGLLADAIAARLNDAAEQIDLAIQSDLDAQSEVRSKQDVVDLTTQILPSEVQTPELLDLVTTETFKEILETPVE